SRRWARWGSTSAEPKLASARAKHRLAFVSSCGSGIATLPVGYCNEFAHGSYYPTNAEGHPAREFRMTSEADFAAHYRNNYRRVLGLCRQLLGGLQPAEDAAQEVFLRAHRSLSSYDRTRPFEGWILTIASNHCID